MKVIALDTGFGGQISHFLKRFEVRRTTIRITRIIHIVSANENIPGTQDFSPTQGQERKTVLRAGT